ncbi:hypothetical protein STEG23_012529 [Scotinomys teguina]
MLLETQTLLQSLETSAILSTPLRLLAICLSFDILCSPPHHCFYSAESLQNPAACTGSFSAGDAKFQAHLQPLVLPTQLLPSLLGLSMKEHVHLFDPVFVIRLAHPCISSVNKTDEICQIIDKAKQLTDMVILYRSVVIDAVED